MTLVKSILLASAAGLCAVTAAQAADLPVRRAAPVEYVRVCSAQGAGFFYIPGSDTCLRVGGRVRFSYQYIGGMKDETSWRGNSRGQTGGDASAWQSLIYINLDARTSTSYGMLRTFIRLAAAYNTGGAFINSGTSQRMGQSYSGLGQDTFGRAQTNIYVDKAFVQFAGFTAGRAASFFDFYAHDLEHFGATSGSNVGNTNLLAYTASFGGGWSATVSIEDPTSRRQPLFADQIWNGSTLLGSVSGSPNFSNVFGTFTQSVPVYNAAGKVIRYANYDVQQRNLVPDVVGAVRYSAPWGAVQVSAAMHELRGGELINSQAVTGVSSSGIPTLGSASTSLVDNAGLRQKVKAEMGWAVQGGLKLNLPQLAPGDVLWLQGAYSEGALSYTGHPAKLVGSETLSAQYSGRFAVSTVDSFIGADGKQKLTESWAVTGAFLHYWTPEWRTAVFGSYAEVSFGKGSRGTGPYGLNPVSAAGLGTVSYNATLKDYSVSVIGANVIWSPIKDLDIGLEGVYTRADLKGGRVIDSSYGNLAFQNALAGTSGTVPYKTVKSDDLWSLRMRVQRDF